MEERRCRVCGEDLADSSGIEHRVFMPALSQKIKELLAGFGIDSSIFPSPDSEGYIIRVYFCSRECLLGFYEQKPASGDIAAKLINVLKELKRPN